jgi:molecular chaperone GrpE
MNHKDSTDNVQDVPKKDQKQTGAPDDLGRQIEELGEKLTEMEQNWKRALADYQNLQRRTAEDKSHAIKFANYELISELIEVYDNMRMMEKHSDDTGLKMIVRQFWEKLNYHGLEQIKAEGKKFDESLMEAVETVEGPEGKVVGVTQSGYTFRDRLVRPARVIVGKKNFENDNKN